MASQYLRTSCNRTFKGSSLFTEFKCVVVVVVNYFLVTAGATNVNPSTTLEQILPNDISERTVFIFGRMCRAMSDVY